LFDREKFLPSPLLSLRHKKEDPVHLYGVFFIVENNIDTVTKHKDGIEHKIGDLKLKQKEMTTI
jgi:hypothetical protein